MTETHPTEPAPESPGPTRTWWHPLLVSTLRWALGDAYEVRDEVSVGKIPPRLDIVLLHRLGEPPELARRELAPLLRILREFTTLELKGPTDSLGTGDLDQFLGCIHLFRAQQRPPLERGALSAAILASALTGPFREDAARLGLTLQERGEGIWEVASGLFPLWVLETDRLALSAETVLAFFSHAFLEDPRAIIEHWRKTGHAGILNFIIQQIQQFKIQGEPFAMQHKDTPSLESTWEDVENLVLSLATPEKRLEGLSPEKRLEGLSPDVILENVSPEEFLHGLTEAQKQQLQRLLQNRLPPEKNGDSNISP